MPTDISYRPGEIGIRRSVLVMRLSFVALSVVLVVATPAAVQQRLAVTHVSIVDVTDGSVYTDQTVVVENDRIVAVGPAHEVSVADEAEVVDASGGYLIPGLWDMHVHGTRRESTYPLYLANGVTGVREMFGPPDARAFRSALAAKQLAAPRIFLAGPIIDGSPPIWPHSVAVSTVEEGRRAVIEQKQHGVDFIKATSYFLATPISRSSPRARARASS